MSQQYNVGHKCQVTPLLQEPTKNNHCVGTMFHNSTFTMSLYTQKSIETNKAPQHSADMRIPLISTEKEMIDLSQLSNSPSTPRKNLVVDISSEVNYTPDHIKPKRLFSSLRDTIDTNKNVSFVNFRSIFLPDLSRHSIFIGRYKACLSN